METPNEKMNIQIRLAEDYRSQLNRFRALLPHRRTAEASVSTSPSAEPMSTQVFAGLLMVAQTEEQVRSYIRANPESARQFVRAAAMWDGLSAPYPPEKLHAADEEDHPFLILGWLNGGDPARTA